jgi:hypothetical protein
MNLQMLFHAVDVPELTRWWNNHLCNRVLRDYVIRQALIARAQAGWKFTERIFSTVTNLQDASARGPTTLYL